MSWEDDFNAIDAKPPAKQAPAKRPKAAVAPAIAASAVGATAAPEAVSAPVAPADWEVGFNKADKAEQEAQKPLWDKIKDPTLAFAQNLGEGVSAGLTKYPAALVTQRMNAADTWGNRFADSISGPTMGLSSAGKSVWDKLAGNEAPGNSYTENLTGVRDQLAQQTKDYPKASMSGNLAGGITQGILTGGSGPAALALRGGVEGGVRGFTEHDYTTPGRALLDTAVPAVVGGAIGGVAGQLGDMGTKYANKQVLKGLEQKAEEASTAATKTLNTLKENPAEYAAWLTANDGKAAAKNLKALEDLQTAYPYLKNLTPEQVGEFATHKATTGTADKLTTKYLKTLGKVQEIEAAVPGNLEAAHITAKNAKALARSRFEAQKLFNDPVRMANLGPRAATIGPKIAEYADFAAKQHTLGTLKDTAKAASPTILAGIAGYFGAPLIGQDPVVGALGGLLHGVTSSGRQAAAELTGKLAGYGLSRANIPKTMGALTGAAAEVGGKKATDYTHRTDLPKVTIGPADVRPDVLESDAAIQERQRQYDELLAKYKTAPASEKIKIQKQLQALYE